LTVFDQRIVVRTVRFFARDSETGAANSQYDYRVFPRKNGRRCSDGKIFLRIFPQRVILRVTGFMKTFLQWRQTGTPAVLR
jgi:hypothetical protein